MTPLNGGPAGGGKKKGKKGEKKKKKNVLGVFLRRFVPSATNRFSLSGIIGGNGGGEGKEGKEALWQCPAWPPQWLALTGPRNFTAAKG